jgi:hypothetical protein
MTSEHFKPCSEKVRGRGMAQKSVAVIASRQRRASDHRLGVGYKLFTVGMIPSMDKPQMQQVYRLLMEARESGMILGNGSSTRPGTLSGVRPGDNPEAAIKVKHPITIAKAT